MNLLICGISNITDFNKRLFSGIRIYVTRFVFSLLMVERKEKIQATHKGYPQRLKNKKETPKTKYPNSFKKSHILNLKQN